MAEKFLNLPNNFLSFDENEEAEPINFEENAPNILTTKTPKPSDPLGNLKNPKTSKLVDSTQPKQGLKYLSQLNSDLRHRNNTAFYSSNK